MHKTLIKELFREIKGSLNRFLAILAIVAIGVAFFVGLKAVGPNMSNSASEYFKECNYNDYRLLSTIGFNDDDVKAIRSVPGVKGAIPVYSTDAIQTFGKENSVVHIVSIPAGSEDALSKNNINSLYLLEGRMPEKSGECVIDRQKNGPAIGDMITLSSGTDDPLSDSIKISSLKVVGIAETPAYLTKDRGTSKLASGKVSSLIFLPEEDFNISVYTEVLVTANGTDGLNAFSKAYSDKVKQLKAPLEKIGTLRSDLRYKEIVNEANQTLSEKQSEYDKSKADSDKAITDAEKEIDDAQKKLNDGQALLNDKKKETEALFADSKAKITAGEKQVSSAYTEYNKNLDEYNKTAAEAQPKLDAAKSQLADLASQISSLQTKLSELQSQLSSAAAGGSLTGDQIAELTKNIETLKGTIAAMQQQYDTSSAELTKQQAQLDQGKARLDAAKKQLDASKAQIKDQKAVLASSEKKAAAEFQKQQQEIDNNQKTLDDSRKTLTEKKAEAEQKLSDAAKKLEDAKAEIADIPAPEWHVLDRDYNSGYVLFKGEIDRLNGLASMLPVFFFTIAALVCLTTMTRMVEEQRTQIGTLKALGYSNAAIAFKYIFYAALATILGVIIGLSAGFTIIPVVIFKAYKIMYILPSLNLYFHAANALIAFLLSVGVTTVAAYFTCENELRSVPASLMRPAAPKSGKRILMERIGFIWKKLSFNKKVTARNLFRYKKRLYMTVLGVACCCAFLVTGLGLKDSIATQVAKKQFDEIMVYDLSVQLKDNITAEQKNDFTAYLKGNNTITSFMECSYKNTTAEVGSTAEEINMIVPSDPHVLNDYFVLRAPSSGKPIPLSSDGIVITQKLSELLHIGIGDTITIKDDDTHTHNFRVDAIAENYLQHYVFLSPSAYKKAYGSSIKPNQILANLRYSASDTALSTELMKISGVSSVRFMSDTKQDFLDMLNNLNYIIWVIIISAGLLAFVVLYTLTTINIGERLREIATIKVLGFFDKEVNSYVFSESYILSLLGTLLGLAGGVFLHSYVLKTAEMDIIMYENTVMPQSFIISVILTMLFTWLANRISMISLRKINMVEALKSNE